jgi:hypothetical protein
MLRELEYSKIYSVQLGMREIEQALYIGGKRILFKDESKIQCYRFESYDFIGNKLTIITDHERIKLSDQERALANKTLQRWGL